MKLDLGKIITIAQVVGSFVSKVQDSHINAPGADKHAIVRDLAINALPVIEGLSGEDLNDPLIIEAIDACIVAEKAALTARTKLAAVVADVKAKRAA